MQPDATHIASVVNAVSAGVELESAGIGVIVRVPLADVREALLALRADGYGFLVDLWALDKGEALEITYQLRSLGRNEDVFVRTGIEYGGTLPSMWEVFPSAAFPEREAAELFGMLLSGHPNPKRLLTTPGCDPYLRKDVLIRDAEKVRLR